MQINSYRNIWKVAYPIIVGSVAQNIINVVDTAFLGQLGTEELGAAGNSLIFYFLFIVLGMGFSIGSEILVGRRNGEENYKKIGPIVDHCFYILIPLSIVLFLAMRFGSQSILSKFTADPGVLHYSLEYFDMRMYGITFAFANLGFRTFFVGTTRTSVLTWSTSFMALVNVIFDYLLIFGKFGFPEMGVAGAALASVIAEASTTLFFIVYTFRKTDLSKYDLMRFQPFNLKLLRSMSSVSLPIMAQHFLAVGSWLIFFLIIEKMGSRELAISHIVRSIYMVVMIPLFGFSAATSTLVSNLIGMNRKEEVLLLVKRVVHLALISTAVFLPILLFTPRFLVSFYTTDTLLIEQTVPILYIISIAMLYFSFAFITFSAVSGTGNTKVSMFIESVTLVIYLSGAYLIAIHLKAPLYLVWCSEFIYFTMMGCLSFLYLKFGNWRSKVI